MDAKKTFTQVKMAVLNSSREDTIDDDADLAALGYKAEFKREFTNLSTISFAFSIMGVASSLTTTFDTPFLLGPATAVWAWALGACMCLTLGASIAELVSAYPTSGGLYSASAYLVPNRYKPIVGFLIGVLNLLGQVAGVASTAFGLSRMIWAAVLIAKDGNYDVSNGKLYGLYLVLLVVPGLLNSLETKFLAMITKTFVFVNLGTAFLIMIILLAKTPTKNSASYTFGSLINESGWSSAGLSFFLGLLSVQWTMTDYDATAHISEEVRRASIAAPVAIFIGVCGTGLVGWLLNIVYVLCSPDIATLPGISGLSAATIIATNTGKGLFFFLWTGVCLTAFFVITTALQANARSFYAFSRDKGLPDRGLFAWLSPRKVPLPSIWLIVAISALLGLLQFASGVALNAIFSLCAIALDTSYAVPIACKMIFKNHPDVLFKPGPFHLGDGWFGFVINLAAVLWVAFVSIIFCLPTIRPVTAMNMNYASVITSAVLILAAAWYMLGAHRHYTGPRNYTGASKVVGGAADPVKADDPFEAEFDDDERKV